MSEDTPEQNPEETPETAAKQGADVPPMQLSVNPRSKHFDQAALQRGVGIRFKGRQRTDIEEYSIPEGWVRVQAGRTMDRKGQPLTLKLNGSVEAWFEDLGEDAPVAKLEG
ncbi:MAG: hypothetical protein CL808_00605 [Citromicrobium sp.]|nr:hypothetical protein [Citromicrobium sp.]